MAVNADAAAALLTKAFGGGGTTSDSSPVGWYDPSKVSGALASQAPGGDGRTILTGSALTSILNPLSGVTSTEGSSFEKQDAVGEAGTAVNNSYYTPTTYKAGNGADLYGLLGNAGDEAYTSKEDYESQLAAKATQLGLDPTKADTYLTGSFQNPTGNGNKDMVTSFYQLGDDGTANPIGGYDKYSPSNWEDVGKQELMNLATVVTAGAAGGAFSAAAGAGSGATAAGGNMALIDSSLGTAGYGVSSASTSVLGQAAAAYKAMAPVLNQIGISPTGAIGALLKSMGVGAPTTQAPQGNKNPAGSEAAALPTAVQGLQSLLLDHISSGGDGTDHAPSQTLGMDDLMNAVTNTTAGMAPGMVQPGNADPETAQQVIAVNIQGKTVLIPATDDSGKPLTQQQAVQQYLVSKKQAGVFADEASAAAYMHKLNQSAEQTKASA